MLSQLKSYLFGGAETAGTAEESGKNVNNGLDRSRPLEEEDWVLVDAPDVISELPSGDDAPQPLTASLEESWIVTQDPPPSNGAAGNHRLYATSVKRRHRSHQPKGTKPRRMRANRKMSTASDDSDSLTSSIAVIASPEPPRAVVAAAAAAAAANASSSSVLAGSLASAKQAAAISAAHMAKQRSDKIWMSRKSLSRANATLMAAGGSGNHRRRQHHVASRMCGSNNNRKCASNFSRKC